MLRSSLGFHTITLFLVLTKEQATRLMQHFKKYSETTGLIKIFLEDGKGINLKYEPTADGSYTTLLKKNKNYRVKYYQGDYRGIEWVIRYNWSSKFKSYIIETTINPKILGGVQDFINAATYADMEKAIINFNREAKEISPLLRDFRWYRIKRVDYCINFNFEEFMSPAIPELVIELIKKADIPPHYEEWKKEYSKSSHRRESEPASLYLTNKSLHINCYSKYMQLKNLSEERVKKGLSPIDEDLIEKARNIIRFEIQCKYRKTYALSAKATESGNLKTNKWEDLLSPDKCNEEINYYFNKIIGKGDWYPLQAAIQKVKEYHFNKQKEQRLIEALQLVNQCRSIAKAKATLQGHNLEVFNKSLADLSCDCRINPVTISKEKNVKHIPNLLYTYYDKLSEEKSDQEVETVLSKDIKAYVKKHGWFSE